MLFGDFRPKVDLQPMSPLARKQPFVQLQPMGADGYKNGGTVGGRWGCALSALIGLPMLNFGLIVASMGDCVPDEKCTSGQTLLLSAIGITIAVGLGSRAAINAVARWRRRDG